MTPATPGAPALAHVLADELVLASQVLNDLAYDLGSDPATLRRHMTSLQTIDRLTQVQLAVAGMLPHIADADAALATVTLEDMATRIRGALSEPRD